MLYSNEEQIDIVFSYFQTLSEIEEAKALVFTTDGEIKHFTENLKSNIEIKEAIYYTKLLGINRYDYFYYKNYQNNYLEKISLFYNEAKKLQNLFL